MTNSNTKWTLLSLVSNKVLESIVGDLEIRKLKRSKRKIKNVVESTDLHPMLKVNLTPFTAFKKESKFCKNGVNMQWAHLNHRVSKRVSKWCTYVVELDGTARWGEGKM